MGSFRVLQSQSVVFFRSEKHSSRRNRGSTLNLLCAPSISSPTFASIRNQRFRNHHEDEEVVYIKAVDNPKFGQMGIAEEEDVHVYYGTPLVREEELNPRKRKVALEEGQARHVAPWNQEVTDSEGRRRFHGAFSGGFSAGYFNTVGSKEGWTPQTFTSSRKSRADKKEQAAYDFMDEDEKAEFEAKNLAVRPEFDTFGSTAAEVARRHAAKEIGERPSVIPGPLIDEIIIPANESTGVKLLLKMGWRRGRQIGPNHIAAGSGARREARKAMMSLASSVSGSKMNDKDGDENFSLEEEEEVDVEVPKATPGYVMNPKKDMYGLGFDPFKDAPEFRERKREHDEETTHVSQGGWRGHALALKKPSLFRPNAGKMGKGFGIGALEDMGEEDEDVYGQEMEFEVQELDDEDKPEVDVKKPQKWLLEDPIHKGSVLPGFHLAKDPLKKKPWFPPPLIPKDFDFTHKFEDPLHSERLLQRPAPVEVQPPSDPEACKYIEGLASFVAKCGPRFEEISKEKQIGNPLFAFLFGGPGHDYYIRRLWEEEQKLLKDGKQQLQMASQQREKPGRKSKFSSPLNAEERGKLLGEIPLPKGAASVERENVPIATMVGADDRARLQSALSSTFTSTSKAGGTDGPLQQPFKNDPAKQMRFEQFMKDKSVGGLRKPTSGGSGLSEVQRSQEIFEFEAVARLQQEGLSLGKPSTPIVSNNLVPDLVAMMGSRFTTAGAQSKSLVLQESAPSKEIVLHEEVKQYPRREEHSWRPSSMLCKRFDLLDPYAGKPPPLPKPRSRTESFILLTNPAAQESRPEFRPPSCETTTQISNVVEPAVVEREQKVGGTPVFVEEEAKVEPIPERPVDLYKAIFSDDSDEEEEDTLLSQAAIQTGSVPGSSNKSAEAADAALNRLVAGDFLESLGKELGLKVPDVHRPSVAKPIAKEMDDGSLGRGRREHEFKGRDDREATNMSLNRSKSTTHNEMTIVGHQTVANGSAAASLPTKEVKQYPLPEGHAHAEASVALFGVKTRYLNIPDNTGRRVVEEKSARFLAADDKLGDIAASASVPHSDDTDSDQDSDKGKELAKKIRREEKRLKQEKEKRKHKHRKHRSSDKHKERKKEKSEEKEGRHHRKHKRRRSPSP